MEPYSSSKRGSSTPKLVSGKDDQDLHQLPRNAIAAVEASNENNHQPKPAPSPSRTNEELPNNIISHESHTYRALFNKGQQKVSRHLGLVREVQPAKVMYKPAAPIIQNPLKKPGPCNQVPESERAIKRLPPSQLVFKHGPDRNGVREEKIHLLSHKPTRLRSEGPNLNPSVATPVTARLGPARRRAKSAYSQNRKWMLEEDARREEQVKRVLDYRDHLHAESLGYETLVGNLLYIDIPGGNDINRSWENFLSEDDVEWGFPYYKGSKERPRLKRMEPYLVHQIKERTWKYPRSRFIHSMADD